MIQGFPYAARLVVLVQFCGLALAFQQPSEGPIQVIPRAPKLTAAAMPVMRVDSSLVLIPVHVTTAGGASVTGLTKENFELFEDGVKRDITHFTRDNAPISAGVILDVSGSMKNKMQRAAEAATEFFKYANPEDEFFLVEFNSRARLRVPFTRTWSEIADEISHAHASGMTAMFDGIHLALAEMKHAHNVRKALIVLSDGGDNFSRRNLRELKSALMESDVQLYALGVFDSDYAVKHAPEERNGPKLLDQVSLPTGGRDFPLLDVEKLPEIGVEIDRELRTQYVLGFSPGSELRDGKFHRVDLKLDAPDADADLHAYYRQGYYAPGAIR